jgi:hypothetical protein
MLAILCSCQRYNVKKTDQTGVTPSGDTTGGNTNSGDTTSGDTTAGNTTAGTTVGETTSGNTTAGDTTAGDTTAGDTTAGDTTAGDTTAGDTTAGDTTAGDTTAGDTTAGDTTAGDTTAGDTTAGGTTAGGTTAGGTTDGSTDGGDQQLPVDPTCSKTNLEYATVFNGYVMSVPKWDEPAYTVPNTCLSGFEVNDEQFPNGITLLTTDPLGANGRTLELDYATYTAPNMMKITGVLLDGSTYSLFESCVLRTWKNSHPTSTTRPCEGTIRAFRPVLKQDTVKLIIEPRGITPYYIRMLGLCDFNLSNIKKQSTSSNTTLRLTNNRNPSTLSPNACPSSADITEFSSDLTSWQ